MNKNYIFLAVLLIVLAGGLFFLPERNNYKQIDPQELMMDIVQTSRFVTTDQVAEMIIEGDPTLELIDVRSLDEYEEFTLTGSINIPLDSLMVEYYQGFLGIEDMNVVFFDNDDIRADQAWVISKRMGFSSLYVLKGGLNCWMNTIIQPKMPVQTASKEEFERYAVRKGASMYFTGAEIAIPDESTKSTVTVTRKKKTTVAEGGC